MCGALLRICRAFLLIYMALLKMNRDLSRSSDDFLSVCFPLSFLLSVLVCGHTGLFCGHRGPLSGCPRP